MRKREFTKFYDRYAPKIYRFIYLKTNSTQDSEDLTSEAFFKFWQNFSNQDNKINNPRAMIYRIAVNLVTDFYRKKSRSELITNPEENNILAQIPDKTDLNKGISLNSDINDVKKAINQLKDEYQNILIWHYLDDFPIKEIAQILEKSEGSIRVMVHRALKELKKRV